MSKTTGSGDFAHSPPISGEASIDTLPNLSVLREAIEKVYDPEQPCSLIAILVDNFADTSDTFGEAAGDELLVTLGERLRKLGGDDLLGRVGRENFIVFQQGETGRQLAHTIVEEARAPISVSAAGATRTAMSVTVSVGCALGPQHGSNLSDLYRSAQHAAARAKAAGGDRAQTSILRLLQPGEVMPASQQLAATVRELIGILATDEQSSSWIHDLVAAYEAARIGGRPEFLALGEMQFPTTAPVALEKNARCRHLQQRIEDLTLVLSRSASK